jgi:hypothetical protein
MLIPSSALYFNASEKELLDSGASPSNSVKVKNGGYIASLGVYHELHCLVKMRNFLYHHRHSQNLSSNELEYWYDHLGMYANFSLFAVRYSLICLGRSLTSAHEQTIASNCFVCRPSALQTCPCTLLLGLAILMLHFWIHTHTSQGNASIGNSWKRTLGRGRLA